MVRQPAHPSIPQSPKVSGVVTTRSIIFGRWWLTWRLMSERDALARVPDPRLPFPATPSLARLRTGVALPYCSIQLRGSLSNRKGVPGSMCRLPAERSLGPGGRRAQSFPVVVQQSMLLVKHRCKCSKFVHRHWRDVFALHPRHLLADGLQRFASKHPVACSNRHLAFAHLRRHCTANAWPEAHKTSPFSGATAPSASSAVAPSSKRVIPAIQPCITHVPLISPMKAANYQLSASATL